MAVCAGRRRSPAAASCSASRSNPTQNPPYDALWPASFVIVRSPGNHFAARALADGRVLERWSGRSEAASVIGNLLLRADDAGNLRATDVTSGRTVWTRKADDHLNPVRGPATSARTIALPDGGMILVARYSWMPDISIGDDLHLLDPRTGKVTDYPVNPPYPNVTVNSTDGPAVTAESASHGVTPLPPLLIAFNGEEGGNQILLDGHRFHPKHFTALDGPLTSTQAAWKSDVYQWGLGTRRAEQVYDRKSGKRLVRVIADKAGAIDFGERIVISAGGSESVVAP